MPVGVELRAVEEDDLDLVVSYLQHPGCWGRRGIDGDWPGPLSRAAIRKAIEGWAEPEHGWVMLVTADSGPVGHVRVDTWWDALSPDLALVIAPDSRRRGYGGAAVSHVLDLLFSHTVAHVVTGWIDDWNQEGLAFARAMGFTEAGRSRRTGVRGGRYHDTLGFDLLRREWEAGGAARG